MVRTPGNSTVHRRRSQHNIWPIGQKRTYAGGPFAAQKDLIAQHVGQAANVAHSFAWV